MAHSSSSYCIDLPFMEYSTDLSANFAVKCFDFTYSSSPCGCSGDLGAARFNHFASKIDEKSYNDAQVIYAIFYFICLRFTLF